MPKIVRPECTFNTVILAVNETQIIKPKLPVLSEFNHILNGELIDLRYSFILDREQFSWPSF